MKFCKNKLSLTASGTLKKLFEEGSLLFSNLSQYLAILVILSQISNNLSPTTVSSTQQVAKKIVEIFPHPVTDIKSSLHAAVSCKIVYATLNIDFISQPFFSTSDLNAVCIICKQHDPISNKIFVPFLLNVFEQVKIISN